MNKHHPFYQDNIDIINSSVMNDIFLELKRIRLLMQVKLYTEFATSACSGLDGLLNRGSCKIWKDEMQNALKEYDHCLKVNE